MPTIALSRSEGHPPLRFATTRARAREATSDEDIVAGLLAGEPQAAEQLYERVHVSVRNSLRRILRGGGADYDDLMQASFERILRVLSTRALRQPYNLPGWASAVAAHVALDALRRRVRERRIFLAVPLAESGAGADAARAGQDPEQRLSVRDDIGRAQALLAGLKPAQAEAVVLHDVLGHDLVAVAEITGVTVAAAQSRLSRGRRDLHKRARVQAQSAAKRRGGRT